MSFITRNMSRSIKVSNIGKTAKFMHKGVPRRAISPAYLFGVVRSGGTPEALEIAKKIMRLYNGHEINRSECQARLWSLASGVVEDERLARQRLEESNSDSESICDSGELGQVRKDLEPKE